jgi:hypothetical protein
MRDASLVIKFMDPPGYFVCQLENLSQATQKNLGCTQRPSGCSSDSEQNVHGSCTLRKWQICVAKLLMTDSEMQ